MIDFLFVYELEQRELENITLLGAELENRGYRVAYEKYDFLYPRKLRKKYINNVKVVIVHSMYNEKVLYNLVYQAFGFVKKIINLQWEQVGTIKDENSTTAHRYPKQSAKTVPHVCWGPKMQEILIRCGMDKERAPVLGPLHMDFLRKEFDGYYMSREALFKEFGIPTDKKVLLFLSSFSYTSLTEKQLDNLRRILNKDSVEAFHKISVDSQREILEWIERYLNENPDEIFIYRPHPAEAGNKLLREYEQRNSRLFVIGKYSVKQWIKTADVIFNWFSTSMAEVYFDGKDGFVLRPVEMVKEKDVAIMRDCRFITTYEDFVSAAHGCNDLVVSADALKSYYDVTDTPAFVRCADFFEEVITTDKYDYEWTSELEKSFKRQRRKDDLTHFAVGCKHILEFTVNKIKQSFGLNHDKTKIDFYNKRKNDNNEHKKNQAEKLSVMHRFID